MQTWVLCALVALCCVQSATSQFCKNHGYTVGRTCKLPVTHDVTLGHPFFNYNWSPYLSVGKHPFYSNTRSLIRTWHPPPWWLCPNIVWAKLYLYYADAYIYIDPAIFPPYADIAPWFNRDIQARKVLRYWNEYSATSWRRYCWGIGLYYCHYWYYQWLDIIYGWDTKPDVLDTTTICTNQPEGWVSWDVTNAVRDWQWYPWTNFGILLRDENEWMQGREIRFKSNHWRNPYFYHGYIEVLCGPPHGQVQSPGARAASEPVSTQVEQTYENANRTLAAGSADEGEPARERGEDVDRRAESSGLPVQPAREAPGPLPSGDQDFGGETAPDGLNAAVAEDSAVPNPPEEDPDNQGGGDPAAADTPDDPTTDPDPTTESPAPAPAPASPGRGRFLGIPGRGGTP